MMSRRVAVIGAGAAGSMAAIFAATAGADTVLLERTTDGGRKILISGGGRCNILPASHDESRFVTDSSPHTMHKLLRSWPLREQIAFFEHDLALPLVEEDPAKLFPVSESGRDVRDRLLAMASSRGARVAYGSMVTGLVPHGAGWRVEREGAPPVEADAVIVATGGLSVPKTGSDGLGLSILERLGHTIHPTYPALTPIIAEPAPFASLAGVSLPVTIAAARGERNARATGGFLFTHQGYSGPALLDISHIFSRIGDRDAPPARALVRWTALDETAWDLVLRKGSSRLIVNTLRAEMPERLALALLGVAEIDASRTLAELRRAERLRLIETLMRCELPWTGHEGYKKAEVTGGGVSLEEIDPRTMESRKHPGLFLCGELLDAFGPIGGYNFQWAWATGRAAGLGAAAGSTAPSA